jgi:Protein ENHANCED DISEASE RESISTANCE 2, C-terminal
MANNDDVPLSGSHVRKMVKEATQRVFSNLRQAPHHDPVSREESLESLHEIMNERLVSVKFKKKGPSIEADEKDDSATAVRSTTDAKIANIKKKSRQKVKIRDHDESSSSDEAFKIDLIGLGITSFAFVPVLAMVVSTDDEQGVSNSTRTSVSIPVLIYGVLIGLITGVFLGRASKGTTKSASIDASTTEGHIQCDNGLEVEEVAVNSPKLSGKTTKALLATAAKDDSSSLQKKRFRNETNAAMSFEKMKQNASRRAVQIKETVKEIIPRRPAGVVSPSKPSPSHFSHDTGPKGQNETTSHSPSATNKALMDQLQRMGTRFKRTSHGQHTVVRNSIITKDTSSLASADTEKLPRVSDNNLQQQQEMCSFGKFDVKEEDVVTLEDVIVPAMKLRGMDIFVADQETNEGHTHLGDHPYLMEHGLRDTGTLLMNLITGHGNIVVYLKLPSYVTQLHDLVEEVDDDEEAKAIKRFINGDDEYRNDRLKVLPSVAVAPFAIRVIAPAKKEIIVNCTYVPCTWRKHEASRDRRTGKVLAPLLEVEIDCMSDKWVRSIVNLCVKNAPAVVVDVGLVIQLRQDLQDDPDYDSSKECEACIGMFRLDRMCMNECDSLPNRADFESSTSLSSFSRDEIRASIIAGLNMDELRELAKDFKHGMSDKAAVRHDGNDSSGLTAKA